MNEKSVYQVFGRILSAILFVAVPVAAGAVIYVLGWSFVPTDVTTAIVIAITLNSTLASALGATKIKGGIARRGLFAFAVMLTLTAIWVFVYLLLRWLAFGNIIAQGMAYIVTLVSLARLANNKASESADEAQKQALDRKHRRRIWSVGKRKRNQKS
jgi:hypothetical protein